MATPKTIKIGATMDVLLRRLRREGTDVFPANATVTYTLFDASGDPVAGAVEVAMPYVEGAVPEDGVYTAPLDAIVAAGLTDGASYTILIVASAPGSVVRPFPMACIARI